MCQTLRGLMLRYLAQYYAIERLPYNGTYAGPQPSSTDRSEPDLSSQSKQLPVQINRICEPSQLQS